MMAGESFYSRKRDFSCLGSVTGSCHDLSSPGLRHYRRDFGREGTRRCFDLRDKDFGREGTKRCFDSRDRDFRRGGTRLRFDSRDREIRSRGGFCFESNRARFDGGIMHQRSSDHGSKKARVCHVEKSEDEKLLPLKKRMMLRFSIFLPEASKSTMKNRNMEFDLVGLPKSESRPLLLPPQLPEIEEGEIVEESWKLPPLVVLGEGKIVGNCVNVKAEALIQRNKTKSEPVAAIPRSRDPLRSCTSLSEYELLSKINEGAYGVVYKAIEKKTGKVMALKMMKHRKGETGLPPAALREIKILFSLKHPSVLTVKEVVKGEAGDFFMAMELMKQDLRQFLNSRKQGLSTAEVKGLMLQLLEGVSYLHRNKVLHRDLKTSNLLLNNEGKLKICDFGLSCCERNDGKPLTSLVVTLWYRAPELLLGTTHYSKEIDMWSVGCILAELLKKEPLFKGKSELDQLNSMVNVLGTPTVKNWPGLSSFPGVSNITFAKQPENKLRQMFPVLSALGLDLLQKLLTYDPRRRITAESALNHSWFREFPLPKQLSIGVG